MTSKITREVVEIAAAMQVKALAFDSAYPCSPLGTWSPGAYVNAILALLPEEDRERFGKLMVEASQRAMLQLTPAIARA